MGVAKLNTEYRMTNQKGHLDFDKTVENLKKMMKLINEIQQDINKV